MQTALFAWFFTAFLLIYVVFFGIIVKICAAQKKVRLTLM